MSGDEEVKLTGRIGQVDLRRNVVLLKGQIHPHVTSIVVHGKEIVITARRAIR